MQHYEGWRKGLGLVIAWKCTDVPNKPVTHLCERDVTACNTPAASAHRSQPMMLSRLKPLTCILMTRWRTVLSHYCRACLNADDMPRYRYDAKRQHPPSPQPVHPAAV